MMQFDGHIFSKGLVQPPVLFEGQSSLLMSRCLTQKEMDNTRGVQMGQTRSKTRNGHMICGICEDFSTFQINQTLHFFACFHLFGWQPIDWNFGVDSNNMGQNLEFVPFGRVNQPQRKLLFISQSFWPLNSNQCLCGPKELRFSLFFGGFSPHILIRHTKKNKAFFGECQ